jgi:DNA-binding transcriptional regulator GbsR (MarR family)
VPPRPSSSPAGPGSNPPSRPARSAADDARGYPANADQSGRNQSRWNQDRRGQDGGDQDRRDQDRRDQDRRDQDRRDQDRRDAAAVSEFIERFAGLLFESGVPRMPARVFVALLTSDTGRLSAADLGAILGVSPAAVSGAVRYLVQVGLVTGAGEPGSRRLFYSVPDDVWQHLLSLRTRTMSRWADMLRDGAEVLGSSSPAGERVSESAAYFDFVTTELPGVLARWDEYKARLDHRP